MKLICVIFIFSVIGIRAQDFLSAGEVDINKVQYLIYNPKWLEGNLNQATMNSKSDLVKVQNLYKWAEYSPFGPGGVKKTFFETSADGIQIWWYENGQTHSEYIYKNGKKEGKTTLWNPNGSKKIELNYQNNELMLKTKYIYDNGILSAERNYQNGKCISWDCD